MAEPIKVLIVDDSMVFRSFLLRQLSDFDDINIIGTATSAADAEEKIKSLKPQVVTLDVEMPGMNGLQLAMHLLDLKYIPAVVFVTGYAQYALEAWDTEAVDFIVKPFSLADIDRAMGKAKRDMAGRSRCRVEIRCFPSLRVIVDGETVRFHHKKSEELLAYLVHHRGAWVSAANAAAALFEDKDSEKAKNYFRLVLYRLKQSLVSEGIGDLLETERGVIRVDPTKFTCDYYRFLEGETSLFCGEYLSEYSWAEYILADLENKKNQ